MTLPTALRRALYLVLSLLALSLAPVPFAHAGDSASGCGASPGGAPCDGSGPASQGNGSATNQGAGNPINLTNGNKYQQETDLPPLPGILGLEIVRHYNSAYAGPDTPNGILGRGWKLSYETELYAIGNSLQIIQADGTRLIFSRSPAQPHVCASNDPSHGRIHIRPTPHGDEYTWTWPNGRRLNFDSTGKLLQILAPSGEFVSLQRDAQGHLIQVTDPQGRTLRLNYLDPKLAQAGDRYRGVQTIDSPVGRYSYAYGSAAPQGFGGNPRHLLANLIKVSYPTHYQADTPVFAYANRGITSSSINRTYHYQDPRHPTLLTGITVSGIGSDGQLLNQRIGSYQYDEQGRGIQSVKGQPRQSGKDGQAQPGSGIEQVDLHYIQPALPQGQPGKTVLTNSLGQTTTYTHVLINDQARLLEVRGPGCASCNESNVRYAYDQLGRQTDKTRLTPQGQPIRSERTERDAQGRPTRISSIAYSNGKAQPAQLQVRYEYAGEGTQPTLIARPSVIPGREHQIRIAYNAAGQPTQVSESGYSPNLPSPAGGRGAGGEGQARGEGASAQATPIIRTTTYTYRTINGRSLLAQIDGPLQNGPKGDPSDSDVTRYEWDGRGSFMTAVTTPGGLTSTVKYDDVGRITQASNAQGFKTTFTYDARNQLTRISSSGANWTQAGISPVVQSYRYDALGNRVETGSGGLDDGSAENKDPSDKTFHPQIRQAFDVAGRLLWQAEALGILKRASYDTEGHLLSSTVQTRSFEQTERYRYDDLNRLIQVADNTGSVRNVVYDQNRTTHSRVASSFQTLKDDFGREIMVASASYGTIIKRYDETNRLIAQSDDKGNTQTYAYDLTGQRIRQSVTPKTGTAQTTTWRYEQGHLVEVNDPNQTERIRYNERGLPASKTVTLKLTNGAVATYLTRYTYTADGSLASQSLPDGTRINYERNGQGQVVALTRQTSPWTLFGWGKTTLVKDLERDLIGLRHVTYGNGVRGQWQRSKEGVLARVVYTRPEGWTAKPTRVAAASQPISKPSYLDRILNTILPAAQAQMLPPAANKLPGALGIPSDPQALFDARLLYDDAGNVLLQKQQGRGPQQTQAYAYDGRRELIAAQTARTSSTVKTTTDTNPDTVWRYYYDRHGNRVLAQEQVPVTEMGQTRKARYSPDSNALITPQGLGREYVWDGQGQLTTIRQEHKELAHYRYNHRGLRVSKQVGAQAEYTLYNEQRQRIADLDSQGKITRQYIWLADHLIATVDAKQPKALRAPAEGFWQELTQTAQALWNSVTGPSERIAFVHVNHLGAPVAATDQAGQTIWQADYAPYGKVVKASAPASGKAAAYTLALRLPGQWEDAESGLYYNDLRYYDPQLGRYLSPDPLGRIAERLGSPNAYSYVNNNPLSYIDPWGLILFAFDGTNNSNPPPGVDDFSNVYKFYLVYDEAVNGPAWYMNGIGRDDPDSGITTNGLDQYNANTGRARVDYMLGQLDDYIKNKDVSDGKGINIDIVGFSRGAALARDFSNRVATWMHDKRWGSKTGCVEIRFMGLWDTVAQFGLNGAGNGFWQLAIPPEAKSVFQAVAVNENRYLFPGESIGRGIQRGFIGSHADIGGSYGTGDLSDVALNWVVEQAKASGVTMKAWDAPSVGHAEWGIVTNPVVHDKSNGTEDSALCLRANNEVWASNCSSRRTANSGGLTAAQIQNEKFINNRATPGMDADGSSPITGDVNMKEYAKWLKANYGLDIAVGP